MGLSGRVQMLQDGLSAAVEALVALDADTLTVAETATLLEAIDRDRNRLDAARTRLMASFSRRDGHRATGHKNLGHWMADRLRRSPTQARKEAKTAEQLAGLSATAEALGNGDISLEHAAAIAEQAAKTDDPEGAQRTLLAEAKTGDPRRVRKAGRRMQRDEARRAEDARKVKMAKQRRTLSFRADEAEKTMWIEGRLPMLDGVKARAALDALAAPQDDDERTYGQRMADALVELVDRADDGRGLPIQRGVPVEVMAVVPVEAIERRAGVPAGTITGGPGGGIDLSDTELCDLLDRARLSWLIVDPHGVPLRHGRTRRYASTDQRRVLRARDGGCAWPGCDAPGVWTLAHHEPPFDQPGSATDLATQTMLCDTHHERRHKGAWSIELLPNATVRVTSPDARTVLTETAAQRRARHGTWELSTDPHTDARPEPDDTRTHLARETHTTYQTTDHARGPARNRGSPGVVRRRGDDSRVKLERSGTCPAHAEQSERWPRSRRAPDGPGRTRRPNGPAGSVQPVAGRPPQPYTRRGAIRTATRRSSAMTRSYSCQSSWVPPAARKISRSSRRSRSWSIRSVGSSGPISCASPSTVAHVQPRRNVREQDGRIRRWRCLSVPPRVTNATTGSPEIGWGRIPAFTTDA